jgi:hypothetical protein
MSTSQSMTAFDLLRFRCLVAAVTTAGAWLCSKFAELWTLLSSQCDSATNPTDHPSSSRIFPAGQPRGFVLAAAWLNYWQGDDSHWRIPSLANVVVSPALLRGPVVAGRRF